VEREVERGEGENVRCNRSCDEKERNEKKGF